MTFIIHHTDNENEHLKHLMREAGWWNHQLERKPNGKNIMSWK